MSLSCHLFFLEIRILEDNKIFEGEIADIQMSTMRRGTIKINDYGK